MKGYCQQVSHLMMCCSYQPILRYFLARFRQWLDSLEISL